MAETHTDTSPYQDIFSDLVRSIMRAQADLVESTSGRPIRRTLSHGIINRHFTWLATEYPAGINRHLFATIYGNVPLRVAALRASNQLPPSLQLILERRASFEGNEIDDEGLPLVQQGPTRISSLIQQSFSEVARGFEGPQTKHVLLKSPLAIAYDFLTVPELPASRAYVLLTLRNHLFQNYNRYPTSIRELADHVSFSTADVEEALSHIQTSLRPRYFSRGEDKLPAEARAPAGAVLRQFLGAKGVLWLRFESADEAATFLRNARAISDDPVFEFAKSPYLDRLPELGEITNELWGIPIPIRGADTLFRGGLKLSSRGGLVVGIHGGPGVGKTSLALALGAVLSPFGIKTLFMTGEETPSDLEAKVEALLPDDLRRRFSFFSPQVRSWLKIQPFSLTANSDVTASLEDSLRKLGSALKESPQHEHEVSAPKPCRAIVVLDGLHDLLVASGQKPEDSHGLVSRLREFIVTCRELQALVILTTGEDWAGDKALDYLVDVALRLTHHGVTEYGKKPDRRILLAKARHQLCAVGTHGIQIAGAKGVRLSPQINYQLDKRAIWKTRLPEKSSVKHVFRRVLSKFEYDRLASLQANGNWPRELQFHDVDDMVSLPRGSNVFLNGEGSGGKAPLALKIALSPSFTKGEMSPDREKILVVSFLYPTEYYREILAKLWRLRRLEYRIKGQATRPDLNVIHLYPGHYHPDQLFNHIEWELDAAELHGRPYTAVVIDGIHNVFLQFPEIEHYNLFWPQLYASLRSRSVTIISTHTTIVLQGVSQAEEFRLDDRRSEPLRHALVQKTDFRFEIDPVDPKVFTRKGSVDNNGLANIFSVRTISAINQPIPDRDIYWSRENFVLFEFAERQGELFSGVTRG